MAMCFIVCWPLPQNEGSLSFLEQRKGDLTHSNFSIVKITAVGPNPITISYIVSWVSGWSVLRPHPSWGLYFTSICWSPGHMSLQSHRHCAISEFEREFVEISDFYAQRSARRILHRRFQWWVEEKMRDCVSGPNPIRWCWDVIRTLERHRDVTFHK